MDTLVNLWTDAGMLALFDPEVCLDIDPAQTAFPFHHNAGVRTGQYAMLSLPSDGVYPTLITDSHSFSDPVAQVHHSVHGLGCEVVSGRLYVTGMDAPGDDGAVLERSGAGGFVVVPNGSYLLDVHLMEPSEPHAPANPAIVVVLRQRVGPFEPVTADPRLLDVTDHDIERIKAEVDAERRAKA